MLIRGPHRSMAPCGPRPLSLLLSPVSCLRLLYAGAVTQGAKPLGRSQALAGKVPAPLLGLPESENLWPESPPGPPASLRFFFSWASPHCPSILHPLLPLLGCWEAGRQVGDALPLLGIHMSSPFLHSFIHSTNIR